MKPEIKITDTIEYKIILKEKKEVIPFQSDEFRKMKKEIDAIVERYYGKSIKDMVISPNFVYKR